MNMSDRIYRILVASTPAGLVVLAGKKWTILQTTVRSFASLDTDSDHSLGRIGAVRVKGPGWFALAYQDL